MTRPALLVLAGVLLSGCGSQTVQQAGSATDPRRSPTASLPPGRWVPEAPPATETPLPGTLCAQDPSDRRCGPTWHPKPPAPGEVVYESPGFRTVPAPADAHPVISRQEAVAKAEAFPPAQGAQGPVEADLVLLTDGDWPPEVTQQRKYDHRLAWMVTVHKAPNLCTMCGAGRGVPNATAYVAVDASTGAVIENESIGQA